MVEFNEYTKPSGTQSISQSYENSDNLENFLKNINFKVYRVNEKNPLASNEKFIDVINKYIVEIYESAQKINNLSNEGIFDKKVCVFIYVRSQGIVPNNQSTIEIFDTKGYRFPLEKFVYQFAALKHCATYIYLEVPRSNPRNLAMSLNPKVPDINLDTAEGLLLLEYTYEMS